MAGVTHRAHRRFEPTTVLVGERKTGRNCWHLPSGLNQNACARTFCPSLSHYLYLAGFLYSPTAGRMRAKLAWVLLRTGGASQTFYFSGPGIPAPIQESCLRLGYLLKAMRRAGRWWSSDKADWKSAMVTWPGRRCIRAIALDAGDQRRHSV